MFFDAEGVPGKVRVVVHVVQRGRYHVSGVVQVALDQAVVLHRETVVLDDYGFVNGLRRSGRLWFWRFRLGRCDDRLNRWRLLLLLLGTNLWGWHALCNGLGVLGDH